MPQTLTSNKSSQGHASSNWLALQKTLAQSGSKGSKKKELNGPARKKRKIEHITAEDSHPSTQTQNRFQKLDSSPTAGPSKLPSGNDFKNGESVSALRSMVNGEVDFTEAQKLPGKYLALDCEMVGVGIDGSESSLARVSLVNFYGAVQMDEFVRQRERVVDYRTQYSGVRESDMIKAKPFEEIQARVAELLKDRILVGHAVHNDLKALLLSHPWPLTRDTQYFAGKHKVVRSRYVALRNLVKQELDITIQGGEHSSVTDARATMAVYRLHRKEWEKGNVSALTATLLIKTKPKVRESAESDEEEEKEEEVRQREITDRKGKRKKAIQHDDDGEDKAVDMSRKKKYHPNTFPGGGRKGVSTGLSTVVRHRGGGNTVKGVQKTPWWKELGSSSSTQGSKGTLRL